MIIQRSGWLFALLVLALVLGACSTSEAPALMSSMTDLGISDVTFDAETSLEGAITPLRFTVTVTGEPETAWVDFALDGQRIGRDDAAPFQQEIVVEPGTHVLQVGVKPSKGGPGRFDVSFTANEERTPPAEPTEGVGSSAPDSDAPEDPDPTPGTGANDEQERLVSGYYWKSYLAAHGVWQRVGTDPYHVRAAGNDWDWLDLPDGGAPTVNPREDWVHFELRREATVGVAWMDDLVRPDAWLAEWTDAGTVDVDGTTARLFTRTFSAGWHSLPSFDHQNRRIYELLFAEADGSPTPYPGAREGFEQPIPGDYCPEWVHDRHVTEDGYATWHPQVDPVYWCYFGHEHGSDPSFVDGWEPKFNRYTDFDRDEAHVGFKLFTFNGDDGTRWGVNIHWASGMEGRKCARWHAFELFVVDAAGNVLVDILGKGDTGGLAKAGSFEPMNPDDCPEVNANVGGQEKNIPVKPDTGYESWEVEWGPSIPIGGDVVFVTVHPGLWCDDAACNTMSPREGGNVYGNFGVNRWVTLPGGHGNTLYVDGNVRSGRFCTDYTASRILDCGDSAAIPQYVAPGVHSITNPANKYFPQDPWERVYVSHLEDDDTDMFLAPRMNVDAKVRLPN